MYEALEEIVKINKKNDPDDADFYTVEWARQFCAGIGETPEEHLAWLKQTSAELDAFDFEAFAKESAEKAKANPELEAYMTGPIDAFSYELMLKSGEIKDVNDK